MKTIMRLLLATALGFAVPVHAQVQDDIRALFDVFVRDINAHDVAAVGQMLQDSRDFLWLPPHGAPLLGRDAALQRLTRDFSGTWRIEPDLSALKIVPLGDSAARLHVPARYTFGDTGKPAQIEPYLLTQTYVKTALGWRLSSVVPVPASTR